MTEFKNTFHHTLIYFESFGVPIGLQLPDTELCDELIERLPPGWRPINGQDVYRRYRVETGVDTRYSFSVDGGPARDFTSRDALLDELEGDFQIYVAEFANPHLFVHAGVIAWQGKAILLPGRSFAGKSTLVTSLVKAGATYYSDEYAVLDADGRVIPYPRRVSLRTGPHGPAGRLDLTAHLPTSAQAATPIPVGLVALLRYAPEAGWAIEPLSSIRGIMAISEQTVAIQRRPADTLAILAKVTESAQVIQGTRGEVDEAVQRLLTLDAVLDWKD